MKVFLYLDASGQSTDTRLWGVLMIIGQHSDDILRTIIKNFCCNCENFQELKGKTLPEKEIKDILTDIQKETESFFYCKRYDKEYHKVLRENFVHHIKSLRFLQDRNRFLQFYSGLKKTNQLKFICLLQTIENALQKFRKYEKIEELSIFIDDENFPPGKSLEQMISNYAEASLQYLANKKRKIYTHPACDSRKIAGIQAIDLFLGYVSKMFDNSGNLFIDI